MMENSIETYCGLICSTCGDKAARHCMGCAASGGQPYHGNCEIAVCAAARKKRFCGECEKFPCETITRYSNDPERGDSGARIERCRQMKSDLVAIARKGVNPVGVCGHHCDYCFLGQWCGGCRSSYNCCSFATLFDSGICPNVRCAEEKSLDGCWMCEVLPICEKGYYGQKDEYIAKASALFIRKHGEARYSETLKRAVASGEDYPKSFDAAGSAANALAVLEKYL